MTKKKQGSYFTHKIPQSEYRNAKDKTDEDRVLIDTELPTLTLKNKDEIDALKEKIREKLTPIFTNFFPEDNHERPMNGPFFERLYKKLGL